MAGLFLCKVISVKALSLYSFLNCVYFFLLLGQLVGDCVDDQFSITGGLSAGTPTICGTNTGYHSKSEVIFYKINMVSTNETRQRFDFSINFTDSNDSDCES